MLFYIRFRTQLRRTRPGLITSLEDAVTKAVATAGGSTEIGRKVLTASFNENRIGFWLDMVIFLERVHKALEIASGELYGYVLAFGHNPPETSVFNLCRALPPKGERQTTGIWCSEDVCKKLDYYMTFDLSGISCSRISSDDDNDENTNFEEYRELLEWRSFDAVLQNASLLYCKEFLGNIPPLTVRFGAAGCAPLCFADALSPQIRSFIAETVSVEAVEELDAIHARLFKERLRQELSPYMTDQVTRFIALLFKTYIAAVKTRSVNGALILEALHLSDASALKIFNEVYSALNSEKKFLVLVACNSTDKSVSGWSGALKQKIANIQNDSSLPGKESSKKDNIPIEVLEVSYNAFLLGQYFPEHLIPELFEEEGLTGEMYFRVRIMLASLGMPAGAHARHGAPVFSYRCEKTLKISKEKVHKAVRNIILTWVLKGKLKPCFNLLCILLEQGGQADDDLILRAIRADVFNGTVDGIEKAIKKGRFDSIVGELNAPVLLYIYKTLKALAGNEKEDVQQIFQKPVPPMALEGNKPCYEAYQAQVQINLAAYYIGTRNGDVASEAVRKALFINRNLGKNAVPAHRLFSIVNLSRQRVDDALEYISFALEQAENSPQDAELVLSCYYAASVNFLYGNFSKAERLAIRAEETALALGLPGWVLRAKFLKGRLRFDMGHYGEALEIFESLGAAAAGESGFRLSAMANTVLAWTYRAKIFIGRGSFGSIEIPAETSRGETLVSDAKLFEIEAAYFAANYEKAKTLAERFLATAGEEKLETYSGKHFLFTEQPDWRSGFAQCENLLFGGKTQGTRMAWIYRTMAQCALRPPKEARAALLGGMQRFMRDELLPDTDPNDAFYFYAWYCMLRDAEAPQVDVNTVVSMAYKRLQRRAIRIDDMKINQTFLNQSRWSSTLRLAAREYKLI